MSTAPASGDVLGGDFELLRPLARGGVGVLWVALQKSTGKERALKTLRPEALYDDRARERFLREATRPARVVSDHVVEVIAAGIDPLCEAPWIALELLDGETLTAWRARRPEAPPEDVREVLRQLGHGLGACHAAGVVHCDLKPDNVFIARSRRAGARFTVKLLDYGIARVIEGARTSAVATECLATPFWAAPDQLEAPLRITPATDVWALGLVAYYALTGRSYWRSARDPGAPLLTFLAEMSCGACEAASERARATGFTGALPGGFDAWFARCLARDPGARFADATEASCALARIFDDAHAVSLRPPADAARAPWFVGTLLVLVGVGAGLVVRRSLGDRPRRDATAAVIARAAPRSVAVIHDAAAPMRVVREVRGPDAGEPRVAVRSRPRRERPTAPTSPSARDAVAPRRLEVRPNPSNDSVRWELPPGESQLRKSNP